MSDLIDLLTDEQARRCTYATREGDGRTCDCKFTFPGHPHGGEQNGCPEMRSAIWALQADLPTRSSQDAADDAGRRA